MAAQRQQEDAHLRVFYMLIVMALMIVRVGLVYRGHLPFDPRIDFGTEPPAHARGRFPSRPPDHLYGETVRLLAAAESALRQLTSLSRTIQELMNHAHALAPRPQSAKPANICGLPLKRLDSS